MSKISPHPFPSWGQVVYRSLLLFGAVVGDEFAVKVVNLRAGNVADEVLVDVGDGEVGGLGLLEGLHHGLHRIACADGGWDGLLQLADGEPLVEFGPEHDVADVGDVNLSKQAAIFRNDRKETGLASADGVDQLA